MRQMWVRMRWLATVLLMGSGCLTTEPILKPPPQPESYQLPPAGDSRFSEPIAYPKETLNQDMILKKKKDQQNGPGQGPRFGAGGMQGQ